MLRKEGQHKELLNCSAGRLCICIRADPEKRKRELETRRQTLKDRRRGEAHVRLSRMNCIVRYVADAQAASQLLQVVLELGSESEAHVSSVADGHFLVESKGSPAVLFIRSPSSQKVGKGEPLVVCMASIAKLERSLQDSSLRKHSFALENNRALWLETAPTAQGIDILLLEGKRVPAITIAKVVAHWEAHKGVGFDRDDPSPAPKRESTIPVGQFIPSIKPSMLMEGGRYQVIYANSPPVDFSNELFEGRMVCMVNAQNIQEPFLSKFKGDKNTFEVQVQGKFKQRLPGILFVGAEITKKMELGLVTRSLCATILNFCRRYNALLHHSFGDKDNVELPHIVSPLWNTVDQLIITPAGQTPPPLMKPFEESEEARKIRKKNYNYSVDIDLDCVYSFSLKTMNMDMERWSLVNIPLMSTLGLHTFWADADLRFLAYAIDPASVACVNGLPKLHAVRDQRRIFALEIQHASNHAAEWTSGSSLQFYPTSAESASGSSPRETRTEMRETTRGIDAHNPDRPSETRSSDNDSNDEEDGSDNGDGVAGSSERTEDGFFDAEDGAQEKISLDSQPSPRTPQSSNSLTRASTSMWSYSLPLRARPRWRVGAALALDEVGRTSLAQQRSRRTWYAFYDDDRVVALKSFRDCKRFLPLPRDKEAATAACFARCSETEQRRRMLSAAYATVMTTGAVLSKAKLQSFLAAPPGMETILLPAEKKAAATMQQEVACCVLQGNGYWSQEVMSLTGSELLISRHSSSRVVLGGCGVKAKIPLASLLEVRAVDASSSPLPCPDVFALVLSTFSRQFVLLLRGAEVQRLWLGILLEAKRTHSMDPSTEEDEEQEGDDRTMQPRIADVSHRKTSLAWNVSPEYLLLRSKTWAMGDRVLLNGRNFTCQDASLLLHSPTAVQVLLPLRTSPARLSAKILEWALQLAQMATSSNDGQELSAIDMLSDDSCRLWIDFLDGVSFLQAVDISGLNLSGEEAVATFLNVYHCLLIHTFLVAGVPSSLFKFQNVFRNYCYDAFGDVLSLAELEHCIIRAAMNAPSVGFFAQAFLPTTTFSFALHVRDIRLLWAVNCLSTSNLSAVPIYEPATLNEQLDKVMRLSLQEQVQVTSGSTVILPQVCQWYHKDLEGAGE